MVILVNLARFEQQAAIAIIVTVDVHAAAPVSGHSLLTAVVAAFIVSEMLLQTHGFALKVIRRLMPGQIARRLSSAETPHRCPCLSLST